MSLIPHSTGTGRYTRTEKLTTCVIGPLRPVRVTLKIPAGRSLVAEIFNRKDEAENIGLAVIVRPFGMGPNLGPAGETLSVKLTKSAKPSRLDRITFADPDDPRWIDNTWGSTLMQNSGSLVA